jgi:competence protein ComEC
LRFNLDRMVFRVLWKIPVFRLLLPYLAGILLLPDWPKLAISLFVMGGWVLFFHRFLDKKLPEPWSVRWLPGLGFSLLWVALGGWNACKDKEQSAYPGIAEEPLFVLAEVKTMPVDKPKSKMCVVCIRKVLCSRSDKLALAWNQKRIQVYVEKDDRSGKLFVGDRLLIRLMPRQPDAPVLNGGFDYGAYLRSKGVCATAYLPTASWKLQTKPSCFHLRALAERIRQKLQHRLSKSGAVDKDYALVSALTLGSSDLLDKETKSQFSVVGISHLLSVSGLHVAVLYAILAFLLSFMNRFERLMVPKQLLLIMALFGYAFVTGLSPSVIRSALMFSLMAMGKCLRRKSQTLNTVFFSALLLLLIRPAFLFDLGFELSYGAVLGIVVVHPKMVALWKPSSRMVGYLWEMLCLSSIAQLATAPLTIHYFHQFPNYFLLNNLVAVPFSSLLIYLSTAFLFFCDVPGLNSLVGSCLTVCLSAFRFLVDKASDMPMALTENLQINTPEIWAWYLLMGSFFVWFFMKRKRWIFPVLLSVIGLQGLFFFRCI